MLALALLTARGASQQNPFQLHQRPLTAVGINGPTIVPCGALPAGTTTWTADRSPYILPLNKTNDPTQPSSACPAFPLPGNAPDPAAGVVINAGSTLVIDAGLGPVQIFSHGAGITVNGGALQTTNTGPQNFVAFDAEPDVASWDGIQILADTAAHRGNASLGYTSIGHALTSITITSGATSTIDPSGKLDAHGNPAVMPYGLALFKSAIGPSYFDGIDVTDTPISLIGEPNVSNSPPLADGLFGTVNNIGSQGIKLTYDGSAPAGSAGVDIEATAFGSSVPFGDTTCLPLTPCAAGTIANDGIQARFAASPTVPFTLKNNRFYRAGNFGIELVGANDPLIASNLFDCNGSGTPNPAVTSCTGGGLKYSAVYLNGATVDLENRVTGNTGGENGLDAIVFNGTVTSSPTFTWKNATNSSDPTRGLGYLINGGMTMNGGTFKVPGSSVVKVKDGSITLNNATLDASDSGTKVFTSLRDNANITSCPTVFVQSCPNPLPAGEWTGIDVVGPATGTSNNAAVTINNASILYPTTGVMAQNAHLVSITSSSIGPTFADGITGVNTPISVTGTTFGCPAGVCGGPAIGHQGINADYGSAGGALPGALTLTGNTFQSSVDEAIIGTGLTGQPADIETNSISNAGSFGINLQGADHLTLRNNAISNSGTSSPTHSAIYLNGVSNADFTNLISGNTGTGNGLNAIVFHGSTSTALAWQTVGLPNATSPNPLGYMLDGDLTVNGGGLTLNSSNPSGDYVPVLNGGKITVNGGPVTGTNATFTSFKEHSRLPTCGSVFVPRASGACQAPAAGDWGGLILASNQANSLTGGEVRYATTGISIGNPGVHQNFDNLTLTNTNVRSTVSDGVHSLSPITIKGGSFSGNGGSAINVDLTAGGVVTGRTLDIENASVSGTGSDGIVGAALANQSTTIEAVGVDHSGGYGIDLVGSNQLTLQNNVVTNAGSGYAAIYLNGYDGDFSANVTGNKGAGNGLDALVFHGTVRGSLTWQTARKTNDPSQPLGYLLDNSLSMPTSGTSLTVNAGDIVKVGNGGTLQLQNVSLRADNTSSSARKIFTSLTDNTAGVAACPSQLLPGCLGPALGDWGGINLSGSGSNGTLINSAVRYAETGISISNSTAHGPTSSSFGLVVSRSSITSSHADAIDALNTSISLTDSTITGAAHGINANVIGSGATAYLRLSGNRFMSTSAEAILGQALGGQPVWITDNHVQNAATFGIRLVGANALVLRNNNVSCSGVNNESCTLGTAPPYPAIYLDGVSADFANNVRGNVGSNNGMDALAFHGDVNSDLNWLTPTVNTATKRLGYLLTGALRVNDGTLKVHPGDVVKSLGGPITIRGGILDASDASASPKLFTSLKDTSAYGVTCPSVFTGLCTSAQPGDWGGLVITNDGLGQPGSANITNGKITDAVTGVAIDSGPTAQFGSSGFGLVIKGTTITDATGDGINAQDTALQVAPLGVTTATPPSASGPTDLERLGAHGIIATFLGGPACAGSCSDSLDIEWATIKSASKDGIVASGLGGQATIVTNNTIDGSGTYGIRLTGADSLTLQNNTVTNSGGTYPPIFLNHVTGEFTHAITGNSGSGNGLNAMVFDGIANAASTPFTFLMPQATGVFGYMLDGPLTVNGDFQSGPGVAKVLSGGIKVNGKLMTDNTVFTSMKDASLGMNACSSVFIPACPSGGLQASDYWNGINVDPVGTQSSFSGGGVNFATTGLTIAGGELDVNHAIIANSANTTGYAIHVTGNGNAVVSCSAIHDNAGGILVDSNPSAPATTVADSDVFNNGAGLKDFTLASAATFAATRVWRNGDLTPVGVTLSRDLPQQAPTAESTKASWASIVISSPNTNKRVDVNGNPIFGKGPLTVTATFDRAMDKNVLLSSSFIGSDNVQHLLTAGHWLDSFTWTGVAAAPPDGTSLTGISGLNSAALSAGTSCIPASEPGVVVPTEQNRVMATETAGMSLDFSTPTIATAVTAAGPDSCSDGSSPTNHSSPANHCGANTVVFNDLANPEGWSLPTTPPTASETYAFFQWRLDTSATYGSTDLQVIADLESGARSPLTVPGIQTLGHDTANVPVSQSVTLPTADTIYDYHLVAVNLNGVSVGPDRKVKTTAPAATLDVSSAAPTPTAGDSYPFTVTARDKYGNTVADYSGTVLFGLIPINVGSVPAATHTFSTFSTPPNTPGDDGTYQTTTILTFATLQTITATDPIAAISGFLKVAVNPAPASMLSIVGFTNPTTAGDAHSLMVTARDPYGNTATGYTGTVHFTSTDGQAVLPANYTFTTGTANDNGVHSFSVTLKTAGTQSITATDTSTSTITGTQSGITVNPAGASTLSVGGFTSPTTAGDAHAVTVTALDLYHNTASGYTGTVRLTSSDSQAVLPGDYTFTSGTGNDNGIHSFTATLKTGGTQSITATDTVTSSITGTQAGITVNPAGASTLTVSGFTSPTTAGDAHTLTVTAIDPYNNTATGYAGTVHFTSTDSQAVLPTDYTFTGTGTGNDNGLHTFSATLKTAGTQSITATDTASSTITGTQGGITVNPAGTAKLQASGYPTPTTAGDAHSVTVTAEDTYGNPTPTYSGTVHLTSSDSQAVLPADSTLTSGTGSFSVTLKTAGTQSITATDTATSSITGTQAGITVNPAGASALTVSGFTSPTTAGDAHTLTVTAIDPYNNTATGYAGTVHFTSSDGQAGLPVDSTLTSGTGSFSVTLKTAGTQSITATDTASSTITGTQGGITVNPAATAKFLANSYPTPTTAGAAHSLTVTAQDAYGNTTPTYIGTVHLTSSDSQAVLPVDGPLTSGTGSFSVTLKTAGTQSITATDTLDSTIRGSQSGITVNPAGASTLTVSGFTSPTTAGDAHSVTVKAVDPYNNTATGYAGTVHFTSSDSQAALPGDSTLTSGTGSFTVTLKTAGTQSITATDTVTTSITGTQAGIAVNPAAASTLSLTFVGPVTHGAPFNLTVTAEDAYGNTATAYTGTVGFTSSDGGATLPANYTFTTGTGNDNGSHAFLVTLSSAGSWTITATDTVTATITGTVTVTAS